MLLSKSAQLLRLTARLIGQGRCNFIAISTQIQVFPFAHQTVTIYLVEEVISARVASKQNRSSFSFPHLDARSLAVLNCYYRYYSKRIFPVIGETKTVDIQFRI